MLDEDIGIILAKSLTPDVRKTYLMAIALGDGKKVSAKKLKSATRLKQKAFNNALAVLTAKKLVAIHREQKIYASSGQRYLRRHHQESHEIDQTSR
jgi:hypothetical protein